VPRWTSACLLLGCFLSTVPAQEPPGGPEPRSEARPDPKVDAALSASLKEVINKGVDLYNGGEIASCYRIYEGALRAVKPLLAHRPTLPKLIDEKLAEADKEGVTWRKAFALRAALDKIRSDLGKPLPGEDKDLEARKAAEAKALAEAEAKKKAEIEDAERKQMEEIARKKKEADDKKKRDEEAERKRKEEEAEKKRKADEKKMADEKKLAEEKKMAKEKKLAEEKKKLEDEKKKPEEKKPEEKKKDDDKGGLKPPPLPGPPLPAPDLPPLPGTVARTDKNGPTLLRTAPTELPDLGDD
jgi:hypothetical protein